MLTVMPDDATQPHSLAYRTHEAAILAGSVPRKYTRLIPHITGRRVLEIGSAEGVLPLTLAREGRVDFAIGLELKDHRHQSALRLRECWAGLGYDVSASRLIRGDIRTERALLLGVDTVVAVRSIYYLREDAVDVMHLAYGYGVEEVVLCGNRGRQAQARLQPDTERGRFNRLASVEGMRALLEGAGYQIATVVDEGDPIVVGRHPDLA